MTFFFQAQHSKNWGGSERSAGCNLQGPTPMQPDGTIFARQAFMLVRNFLVPNLTVKAGRQLVVWGNHRMFGHFDWNNVGWTHDGLTTELQAQQDRHPASGLVADAESNCRSPTSGNCIGGSARPPRMQLTMPTLVYVRAPMKIAGLVLEPTYIWHSSGTGGAGQQMSSALRSIPSYSRWPGRQEVQCGKRPRGRHDGRVLPIRGDS